MSERGTHIGVCEGYAEITSFLRDELIRQVELEARKKGDRLIGTPKFELKDTTVTITWEYEE